MNGDVSLSFNDAIDFINSIKSRGYHLDYTVLSDGINKTSKWCGVLKVNNEIVHTVINAQSLPSLVLNMMGKMYHSRYLN